MISRDYARWHSLSVLVDMLVNAYEDESEHMINAHFGGDANRFSEALAYELSEIQVPAVAHISELLGLITDTSTTKFELSYEDNDYLTRVRSHLCDALAACMGGDIEAVAGATDKAYRALDFMTYKRKRTDRRDFHKPFAEEKRRFEILTARTSRLARALDKEAVSA